MEANRIEAFQTAFRNLQLQPLIAPEEISNFRVEYGDEWLDDLEQMVLDCSDYNNQLFFAGHRGCGKSTLLAEFAQRLDDRYFAVFFSIADLIEMSAIDHINILFAIAVQLTAKADDDDIDIDQSTMDGFFDWFKERTRIEDSTTKGSGETGFDLFGLIKLKLQTDNTIRDEIKTKFTKNPRELPADIALQVGAFSGGVVRELIRIAQECCRLMLVQLRQKQRRQESIDDLQIDAAILNQALDILRNEMSITLSKTDREILKQTYDNYRPDDPKQQDFLDLLHNIYAIEYRNTESWYDLHPLVIKQLIQEGLIASPSANPIARY